jgi:hypothetical protein
MKTVIWTLIFLGALTPVAMYFYQRWRQKRADRVGVSVYATVVSIDDVKRFGKVLPVKNILLSLQEPGGVRRAVTLSTRIPEGQEIGPGMLLPIVVDPKNPSRVYPAGAEAAQRAVMTGPRRDRRQMKKQRPGAPKRRSRGQA